MKRFTPSLNNPWFVAMLFAGLAIVMTWPLVPEITTEIAGDLGDPAFNCWVMMWTGGQLLRFLKGDWTALHDFWNGNIFYPERLTIAYSEHLTPQMLQALPVYALTGNIVLAYNLLFLSTIVLSGLGMYLFVREVTGRPLAGFVAGVAFAFSPYRAYQTPHLQIISTQWMPLALYGFRCYFANGNWRPLIGGASALVVQILSSGYYIFFFAPFAALYCAYEAVVSGRWRQRRTWMQLSIAAIGAGIVILPFLLPYMDVRKLPGFGVRTRAEVVSFSADTWAFATAYENLALVGPSLQTFVRGESKTYPGMAILLLALLGTAIVMWRALRREPQPPRARWHITVNALIIVATGALVAAWLWLLTDAGGIVSLGPIEISVHGLRRLELQTAAVFVFALASPDVRRLLRGTPGSIAAFLVFGVVASLLMTLGPDVRVKGVGIGTGPYEWFYQYLPGFNGMRVPARFFMVTTLFLAALCGLAIAALQDRWRRAGAMIGGLAVGLILAEGFVNPFVTNQRLFVEHFDLTPRHLASASTLGPVYERVRDLPGGTVLAEIPYGAAPYDALATFYAGYHRKPLINGYSGFFPAGYNDRISTIGWNPTENADVAWKTLLASGATHVVVHEAAYFDGKGETISSWLRSAGASELVSNGGDRLFSLRESR